MSDQPCNHTREADDSQGPEWWQWVGCVGVVLLIVVPWYWGLVSIFRMVLR